MTKNPTARAKPASDKPVSPWLWGLLLVGLVIVAYLPALRCGFIWDDDDYVTQNLTLRDLPGLRNIWLDPNATPQYYPLVHTTFWMEYHLWRLAPLGYHLINVLLHALAAWLLYRILARLRVPGAWLAAAIFGLHPVQVESVAWVTERKNVLSAVFYFASALAYLRFDPLEETKPSSRRPWKWYVFALALFVAALLSKTVTCTLPAALLLACWWKRGRVRWADAWPLLPFCLAGALLGLSTAWMEQHHVGAHGAAWALTFAQRCLIAGRALWFYAQKLAWPAHLTFIYPRWKINPGLWWQCLYPAAAAGLVAALWAGRRRLGRGPLAAVLLFAGTLGPALGFVNVYPMRFSFVADHFQYLGAIGLMILLAAWASRWPQWCQAFLLAILAVLTWRQIGLYRDSETLWRTTLAKNPDALIAHNKLGVILLGKGQAEEASSHFQKILEDDPDFIEARCNMGLILFQKGQMDEAAAQFQRALQIEPDYDEAHNGLGSVLLRQGHVEEAAAHFRKALALHPTYLNARLNLGLALVSLGRPGEAVVEFEKCLLLQPDNAPAHGNLGDLFLKAGRVDEAIAHYQAALAAQSANPALLNDLAWIRAANAQARVRDGAEAVRLAERACQLTDYQVPITLNTLAAAYAEAGRFDDAVAAEEKARQCAINQGHKEAADQLLATIQLYQSRQPYHEPSAPARKLP